MLGIVLVAWGVRDAKDPKVLAACETPKPEELRHGAWVWGWACSIPLTYEYSGCFCILSDLPGTQ